MLQQDMKACKLDTRCELADQFVDDLVAAARAHGGERAKTAAAVLERWDRRADADSVGTLIFLHWATAAGATGANIGGFAVPLDDRRPLETPRGFADPARAVAALEDVAAEMERTYGTLEVKWGDALRFPPVRANTGVSRLRCLRAPHQSRCWQDVRRLSSADGGTTLPGNGAPGALGAIRTIGNSSFRDGITEPIHGDTWL